MSIRSRFQDYSRTADRAIGRFLNTKLGVLLFSLTFFPLIATAAIAALVVPPLAVLTPVTLGDLIAPVGVAGWLVGNGLGLLFYIEEAL